MAADQVVCPFLDVVFKKLEDLIKTNFDPSWGVEKELNELYNTFCKIKYVLRDAEERQFKEGEELIRLWLQKLNDASYKTDDVLDEFAFKAPQPTKFRLKVQKLIESFHAIDDEASKFALRGNIKTTAEEICPGHESISSPTEHVYGRDEDREKLAEQLLGDDYMTLERFNLPTTHPKAPGRNQTLSNSMKDVSTCSIVGIGGVGKTTLAQLLYKDVRITKHFEVKFWVCVSNDFDVKRIIKAIIALFPEKAHDSEKDSKKAHDSEKGHDSKKTSDPDDLESLRFRLQKELSGGKRFLLVLDDVCDISQQEWKKLKEVLLKCGAKGSSIIVTTRLQTTASITSTHPPHRLKGLSKRYCLALFKQCAFGLGNEEIPALVKIGKKIVKKCRRLPLAAKAMGSMLFNTKEESDWNEVEKSKVWELPRSSENNILPSLRLSYYHLLPTWKQCFAYCSIFPKGYLIEKQQLIQLWIANGLVQSRAKKESEDVGNEIFNGLLQRSFFQDEMRNEVGDIISCKMHDFVHDLAIYIAGYECVGMDDGSTRDITERTRHVSLMSDRVGSIKRSSSCLRSLLNLNHENVALVSKLALSKFMCLRALDLHSSGIKALSVSIGKMIHLRYLNLSRNWDMTSIPESICSLRNLQTLNLQYCGDLKSLPKDMRKMSSLRHLDIQGCASLESMPIGMGKLTCLYTLSNFIVGKESGNGVDELQGLNNLRGELEIRGLEKVKNPTEAKVANLMNKKHLHSLGLMFWSYSGSDSEQDQQGNEIQEEIIEGLQPHENLRKLKVEGYGGVSCSPSWLTAVGVPNLVEITLQYCTRCEHLPPLGKLRYLKVLKLFEMDSLKFIDVDDDVDANVGGGGGFPSLEEIDFSFMHNLKGWSSSLSLSSLSLSSQATQVAVFPRLKKVSLFECPNLTGGIPLACSPVQSVDMFDCNGMFLGSLRDLPCLPYLKIKNFDKPECFPPGALRNLTALETLVIKFCDNLKSLPVELKSLAKLTTLEIYMCSNLVSLVEGGLKSLSSLKTLEIVDCDALERLPELEKTSLVNLTIKECPKMEFLKEDFEQLVALETLALSDLPKLTCFPEGIKDSAAKLKCLEIGGYQEDNDAMDLPDWIGTCLSKLEHLEINAPNNWKVLPQWMQHLAALETLWVWGCNKELIKRWERWNGKTHFGSEEDDEEDEEEEDEEYNEDDEEDEEDYEEDEEDNEDNKEDEDNEREDNCFNMISHVPDVELFSDKRQPDWFEYDSDM